MAKIYKAYISEVAAIINGNECCAEINIVGDAVSGIFDTPDKSNINSVFSTAAMVSSLIRVLNCKLTKINIDPISVGIGLSWGKALMIKAGFKGSGINDVVWMGDVVNEASNLCGYGNATSSYRRLMVSSDFYVNLNEHNKGLLKWNKDRNCYHGNIVNVEMDSWYDANCK